MGEKSPASIFGEGVEYGKFVTEKVPENRSSVFNTPKS